MGSKFNASLYAYQMKNRFRDSYADKVDVAQTAKKEPEEFLARPRCASPRS
jgi:hypothetical protein